MHRIEAVARGLRWLVVAWPTGSARSDCLGLRAISGEIRNRAEEVGECDLRCWFPSGPPQIMVEEAQGLGRYGKVISVLTLE